MSGPPGKPIDRAALERIMQRAAELQAAEADVGEGLTADEIMALGREVGIPGRYLQQAMLEQAAAGVAPVERGLLGTLVGPRDVSAQRVLVGDPDDLTPALIEWFDTNELLVVLRQQPGRLTFEPLRGVPAALRRATAALGSSTPRFMLARVNRVAAAFTRLEAGYCHVALTADLGQVRSGFIGGGIASVLGGLGAAVVAGFLTPFPLIAALPALAGGGLGWFVVKRYRPAADRARLGLERALDHLERGAIKPGHQIPPRPGGLLEAIAGEVRKALGGRTANSDR